MPKLTLSDLRAKALWCYEDASLRSLLKTLLTDVTPAMVICRLMQWSRAHRLVPLEWLCNKLNIVVGGCMIGRGAEFGPAFVLLHSMGVAINGRIRGGQPSVS